MAKKEPEKPSLEREYIIPLRRSWLNTQKYKRANKAIKTIKKFIVRHMKFYERELDKVKIDKWVNNEIWARGIKKPPAKIKVKAKKYSDRITVELAEIPKILQYKIDRENRQKEKSEKAKEKIKEEKAEETKTEEAKPEEKKDSKEKAEETKEEKTEKEEKKESVIESGLKQAEKAAKQHRHETTGPKVKSIQRKALKK